MSFSFRLLISTKKTISNGTPIINISYKCTKLNPIALNDLLLSLTINLICFPSIVSVGFPITLTLLVINFGCLFFNPWGSNFFKNLTKVEFISENLIFRSIDGLFLRLWLFNFKSAYLIKASLKLLKFDFLF